MPKNLRTDQFLVDTLEEIWSRYFFDLQKQNDIYIHFGRRATKRLGSIRRTNIDTKTGQFDTKITINGHFRNPEIPEYVIVATIAHELCHYAHGFSSPLPQQNRFPHRGGIIDREMRSRRLNILAARENAWLQKYWLAFLENH